MDEELKACRYRVEKTGYGFWPYCVRAGDGTRELFKGHQKQCMVVAAELETAFEDGKFVAERAILLSQGGEALAVENAELKAELALALKVPSIAAMHTWLDSECAKKNKQLSDELAELKARAAVPTVATPEMELAAEKYWNYRRASWLSNDPRNWAGVYDAMIAAVPGQSHSDGVIVPDRMVVPKPIWKDARHPYGDPLNAADIRGAELFNLAIDEVLRLNRENTNDQATIV